MRFHALRRLFAFVSLLCMAIPAVAFEAPPFQTDACEKPEYPRAAAGAEGISVLGFLVRADGTVASAVVLNSSGSAAMDQEVLTKFSRCSFRPARSGEPADRWVSMQYIWIVEADGRPELDRAKRTVAQAARKGDIPALYHFSLIVWNTARTDADREQFRVMLRAAAEQGHAHAQFHLGQNYEKGITVEANLDEALRWYEKSAAQGDPLATQRLKLGRLLDQRP